MGIVGAGACIGILAPLLQKLVNPAFYSWYLFTNSTDQHMISCDWIAVNETQLSGRLFNRIGPKNLRCQWGGAEFLFKGRFHSGRY